jgi:hypothetical protein
MPTANEEAIRRKAFQRLFDESFKRVRKKGLSEYRAGQIAKQVAEESLERIVAPTYRDQQQLSRAVTRVCTRLSEGASYYALIGEIPYLASTRIDRVVGVATKTDPPVDAAIAAAAKRATRVERLSAAIALLFTGLALGTLGLWWAMGVGAVIAIAGEIYVQTMMPARARRVVADLRAPLVVNVASAAVLAYCAYLWIGGSDPRPLYIFLAGVSLLVVAFVLPGVTVAVLVGRREKKRRIALEEKLLAREADDTDA